MRQQLIQLLLAAVVVLGPVLNWLYHTLKKQKARRDAELERERRELEQLRTGRPVAEPTIPPAELRRRQEVNTRREAELAELRRRMSSQAPPEGILIQIPGTSGPIVVQRVPRPAPTAPSRPGPQRTARPQRSKRAGKQARPATAPPRPAPERRMLEPEAEVAPPSVEEDGVLAGTLAGAEGWTASDWRRAILIREVLGTPLGLRGPDDRPG